MSTQGEEGWRQPCSNEPCTKGWRRKSCCKAQDGQMQQLGDIRDQQPRATMCSSFLMGRSCECSPSRTSAPSTHPG